MTGFLRSVAAVKVSTAGSLLSSKLFGFFVCIYFLFLFFSKTRWCASLPKNPVRFIAWHLDRVFFPLTPTHRLPFLHYIPTTHRRFLSLNLWKLLCSRVSHSFQFRKISTNEPPPRHTADRINNIHTSRASSKQSLRVTLSRIILYNNMLIMTLT